MKHILYSLILLISSTVSGQRVDFNFQNTTIGFYSANFCKIVPQQDAMKVIITGSDPYFMSPLHLNINASVYKKMKIRLKNRTNIKLEVFWITENERNQGRIKSQVFLLDKNNQTTDFIDYTIDLSKNKDWKGKIYQIRIDPGDGLDPNNIKNGKIVREEFMEIEYIKFLR